MCNPAVCRLEHFTFPLAHSNDKFCNFPFQIRSKSGLHAQYWTGWRPHLNKCNPFKVNIFLHLIFQLGLRWGDFAKCLSNKPLQICRNQLLSPSKTFAFSFFTLCPTLHVSDKGGTAASQTRVVKCNSFATKTNVDPLNKFPRINIFLCAQAVPKILCSGVEQQSSQLGCFHWPRSAATFRTVKHNNQQEEQAREQRDLTVARLS